MTLFSTRRLAWVLALFVGAMASMAGPSGAIADVAPAERVAPAQQIVPPSTGFSALRDAFLAGPWEEDTLWPDGRLAAVRAAEDGSGCPCGTGITFIDPYGETLPERVIVSRRYASSVIPDVGGLMWTYEEDRLVARDARGRARRIFRDPHAPDTRQLVASRGRILQIRQATQNLRITDERGRIVGQLTDTYAGNGAVLADGSLVLPMSDTVGDAEGFHPSRLVRWTLSGRHRRRRLPVAAGELQGLGAPVRLRHSVVFESRLGRSLIAVSDGGAVLVRHVADLVSPDLCPRADISTQGTWPGPGGRLFLRVSCTGSDTSRTFLRVLDSSLRIVDALTLPDPNRAWALSTLPDGRLLVAPAMEAWSVGYHPPLRGSLRLRRDREGPMLRVTCRGSFGDVCAGRATLRGVGGRTVATNYASVARPGRSAAVVDVPFPELPKGFGSRPSLRLSELPPLHTVDATDFDRSHPYGS